MSIRKGFFEQIKRGSEHHFFGKPNPHRVDVVDQRFGKLVAVSHEPGKGVKCLCDCGRIHIEENTVNLRNGRRKSCGLCTNRGSINFKPEEDALIVKWAGIKSTQEIADLINALGFRNCTISTVKNRTRRLNENRDNTDKISLRRKGELYPHAKGTDQEVEWCRMLYDEGLRQTKIAEIMEMNVSHVSGIVSYRNRTESANGWGVNV